MAKATFDKEQMILEVRGTFGELAEFQFVFQTSLWPEWLESTHEDAKKMFVRSLPLMKAGALTFNCCSDEDKKAMILAGEAIGLEMKDLF